MKKVGDIITRDGKTYYIAQCEWESGGFSAYGSRNPKRLVTYGIELTDAGAPKGRLVYLSPGELGMEDETPPYTVGYWT